MGIILDDIPVEILHLMRTNILSTSLVLSFVPRLKYIPSSGESQDPSYGSAHAYKEFSAYDFMKLEIWQYYFYKFQIAILEQS